MAVAAVTTDVTASLIAAVGTVAAASIGGLGAALVAARASRASAASSAQVLARIDIVDRRVHALDARIDDVELIQAACTARTTPMIHRGSTPAAGT